MSKSVTGRPRDVATWPRITLARSQVLLIITKLEPPVGIMLLVMLLMLPPVSLDIRTPKARQSRSAALRSFTVVTAKSKIVVGLVSSATGTKGVNITRRTVD